MTTEAPPDVVRLVVNGRPVEAAVPRGRRLLDVLRRDLGLTGTKEGCGEGECGACAVLVDGRLANSCLVPVGQVEGSAVRTVEGLGADGGLDLLQQAFLELGGTQCGVCAPGMLLSGWALLDAGAATDEDAIRAGIAGNLCRCTGYTRVIAAIGAAAAAAPVARPTLVPQARDASLPPITAVAHDADGGDLERPATLADALARLAGRPELVPVAGATDLLVDPAHAASRRPLLDLGAIADLRTIHVTPAELVLGAGVTWDALIGEPAIRDALPVLAEVAGEMGAPAIRNRATVGGNCVTASPAADLPPVLFALDARLEIAGPHGRRVVDAAGFWTAYRQTALAPGELLVALRIPRRPGREIRFRKVGTRRALSIAKVGVALAWTPDGPHGRSGRWRDVRVALASVAPTPIRAPGTERLLEGRVPDLGLADAAARALAAEIHPIDDIRSTADYRRAVAGRVLRRMVLEASSATAGIGPR